MRICIILLSLMCGLQAFAQNGYQLNLLEKINILRAEGCHCDGEYMPPVEALTWNKTLMTSALWHAQDMDKNNYFSHYSPEGEDIGDRLDEVGYVWSYCGENLGVGQINFDQVFRDWIKSKSHCKMLMNDRVEEMALAHVSKYWVIHFGRPFRESEFPTH